MCKSLITAAIAASVDQAGLIIQANIACFAHRGRGAFLDRFLFELLISLVCVVFFRAAAAEYFLAFLLVSAAPVVLLASRVTVSRPMFI